MRSREYSSISPFSLNDSQFCTPLSVSLNAFKMWFLCAGQMTPLTSVGGTFIGWKGTNTTALFRGHRVGCHTLSREQWKNPNYPSLHIMYLNAAFVCQMWGIHCGKTCSYSHLEERKLEKKTHREIKCNVSLLWLDGGVVFKKNIDSKRLTPLCVDIYLY